MPGQLFTNYFLEEGILRTRAWQQSLSRPADFESFRAHAHALLKNAATFHTINEDIADHLLFGDARSKPRPHRYPDALL